MSLKTGISIQAGSTPESIDQIASGLIGILQAGFDAHADQATIQVALQTFGRAAGTAPVTLSNCHVDAADRIQN